MKSISVSFLLVSFFLFISCSKTTITSPPEPVSKAGGILLKVDKEITPSGITTVIAYLTNNENDSLTASLNLLSENSADILFDEVTVGEWYLRVDALNSEGIIKYTGETDITVVEGTTIQINLTLLPTGNGSGNIYLLVSWGNQNGWIDYDHNPVFDNNNPYGVTSPKLLIDGSKLKMWYRIQGASGTCKIGYAESITGINWEEKNASALLPGEEGCWDSYSVTDGVVIKENNSYKMYYRGSNVHSGYAAVGLAFSTDGITWEKYPEPILIPTNSEVAIGPEDILKVNGKYYLYYNITNYPYFYVGLATSTDGIHWNKYQNNPVIVPTEEWEGTGTYFSSVLFEDGLFKIIYMNYNEESWGFGKAVSVDGKYWEKSNFNPVFSGNQTSGNWANKIIYPCIRKFNDEYRIYYSSDDGFPMKIGFTKTKNF